MKKIVYIVALLLVMIHLQAQTTYSPVSTGFTTYTPSEQVTCSGAGTSSNILVMRLVSITGSNATFQIKKGDGTNFTCAGLAYIKYDGVCGTVLNSGGQGYAAGAPFVNVIVSLASIPSFYNGSKNFYALTIANVANNCAGARSHTKSITVTATTTIGLSAVGFTSSSTINYNCNLNFSWSSQNMQSNVKLEVVEGSFYQQIYTIASSTSNSNGTNYYAYNNVQLFPSSQFRIRVSGYGIDGTYKEAHSPYFTVTQGTINITSPTGGQSYALGGSNTINIVWNHSNLTCTNFTGELWNANTNTFQTTLFNNVSSSPRSWAVSGVPAGTYKVKLYRVPTNSNANVVVESGNFIITAATFGLELNAPLSFGTSTLNAGNTYTFTTNVKNQGGAGWSGSLYVVINGQVVDLLSHTINAGQSVQVTKQITLTSAMVGTNVPVELRYQTNGNGASVLVPPGPFHSNPITVTINAAQAYDLRMNANMAINPASPVQNTNANISAVVKNVGTINYTGALALKLFNNNQVLVADLFINNSITVAPNATTSLVFNANFTYAPGTYYLKAQFKPTGSSTWSDVSANGFVNPQQITVVSTPGTCTITNPIPGTEAYTAANYLCQQGIIDNPANGNTNPSNLVIRQDLAKIMFVALFGSPNLPTALELVNHYPTPFGDLQDATVSYYRYMKVLSYLDFNDGKSPFSRRFYYANPGKNISRKDLCKVICETWNLTLVNLPTNFYFNDLNNMTTEEVAYVNTCANKGIISTGNTSFAPQNMATREHVFIMVHRLLTSAAAQCPKPIVTEASFFQPGNYTPDNLGNHPSLSDTNFDQYAQVSFSIADRQLPLVFEHNYNSYLTELPDEIINRKPLGEGWSHSYNSFIFRINGYSHTNPDNGTTQTFAKVWAVFWPNGAIHLYNAANNASLTKGNYDQLTVTASGTDTTFVIKKKNQVTFTFKRGAAAATSEPFLLDLIKDRNNNTIDLNYTLYNGNKFRLFEVVAPSGRKLTLAYNGNNDDQISSVTDPMGRVVHFDYGGPEGTDLIRYSDADNKETTYNYGQTPAEYHLLKVITLPNGNFVDNSYNRRKLNSTKTKTSTGAVISQTAVNNFAHSQTGTSATVNVTTAGNNSLSYGYGTDKLGNVTSLTAPTYSVSSTYNTAGNNPMKPATMTLNGVQAVYTYDNKGNVLTSSLPDPNGGSIVHTFTYNSFNDPLTYTNPRNFQTTFGYNGSGNLTSVANPIGTTTFSVNGFGQVTGVTNPENISVSYGYNNWGNITSVSAPLGISSSMNYDLASRVTQSVNPMGKATLFGYDNRDNLTSTTDAMGNLTQFEFDNNSNLKKIINAKGGQTTLNYNYFDWLTSEQFGSSMKQYAYDNEGKLTTFTKPDGTAINYTYNTEQLLASDGYTSFTYDSPRNRLKTVTYQGKVLTFNYDNLDRIISIVYDGNTVEYTYDKNNNVVTLKYPGNKTVTYTYDAIDRLKTVTDWNNQMAEYFYKNDGRLNNLNLPNGVVTTYNYDAAGRMTGYETKKGTTIICNYTFSLNPSGSHTLENKQEPFNTFASLANVSLSAQYDPQNRIITYGAKNFTFDANGRTTTKTGRNYGWDVYDRLISVSGDFTAAYEYDGLGNRRKAVRNGTTTKYVLDILGMSQVLMETDGSGNVQNYYVYGLGLLSRIKPDNSTRYYHGDFRGSVVAMTDAAGTVTHKYQYDEFGTVLRKTEADENRFRYVGMAGVMFEDSTLVFMRARYYDPEIGRFLSEDPIWSVNLYPYANGNPVMGIDPTGMNMWKYWQIKNYSLKALKMLKKYSDYEDLKKDINNGKFEKILDELTGELISAGLDHLAKKIAFHKVCITSSMYVGSISGPYAPATSVATYGVCQLAGDEIASQVSEALAPLIREAYNKANEKINEKINELANSMPDLSGVEFWNYVIDYIRHH
jgi:RHS repeat-associated protein